MDRTDSEVVHQTPDEQRAGGLPRSRSPEIVDGPHGPAIAQTGVVLTDADIREALDAVRLRDRLS